MYLTTLCRRSSGKRHSTLKGQDPSLLWAAIKALIQYGGRLIL
jgi:hypothetical protein